MILIDFNYLDVYSVTQLEEIVTTNIEDKEVSYYYFYSTWDPLANKIANKIRTQGANSGRGSNIYLIDIFDIPNAIGVMRSVITELKPTISLADLKFAKIPQLVCLHKAFPRLVDNNGSLWAELGM